MLKYTPIVINFQPAVLTEDDEQLNTDSYYLKIQAPGSRVIGPNQTYPGEYTYRIPTNGVLRLKLASSDTYIPKGRYVVTYYKVGRTIPIKKEEWVVPLAPDVARVYYYFPPNVPVGLPPNFYSLISAPVGAIVSLVNNTITWTGDPQHNVELVYQPGATLDQLVQHPFNQLY